MEKRAGTDEFQTLPDDWKCPRCKQSQEKFGKA
ncbi:MAG: rubredoxin [Lachnospiraceae bacterium]|nr:rubredoxin [Lachnospiraceae bacterium]